jgi:uncharacterized protein (DUF433 family)
MDFVEVTGFLSRYFLLSLRSVWTSLTEQRSGVYWITGTRISLDSIIAAFNRGAAPETIRRSFPLLTLEEVYGAITFYLAHEKEIAEYLQRSDAELGAQADTGRQQLKASKPELYERVVGSRDETKTPQR